MAINKVVNSGKMNHGAMRNVLEYVLKDGKVKDGLCLINGPYNGIEPQYDQLYQDWLEEKRAWGKDSGRMYAHNIMSFHKDENITPEQVLVMAKDFSERFFHGHQYVITVHQDRDHLHAHMVTNTVSFLDGKKLHQTKNDLQKQKEYTNELCRERGLSVAEKGKHFDGSLIEQSEITSWDKDKYNLMLHDVKKSFVVDCAIALMDVVPRSFSREEFISSMKDKGWSVNWEDNRKHIVFQNKNGDKVRDTNLEKTFSGIKATKEALTYEFERNASLSNERECADYYAEIESVLAGADVALEGKGIDGGIEQKSGIAPKREGRERKLHTVARDGEEDEFKSFITEYRAKENDGRKSVESSIRNAENAEHASIGREAERRFEELMRRRNEERARELKKEKSRSRGFSR